MAPLPDPVLTSTRNPRIKAAVALRDRRARDEAGITLIDGPRELARALAGGAEVVDVFVHESPLDDEAAAAVRLARDRGAAVTVVTGGVLDRLAYGDRSDGVVAAVRIPDLSLEPVLAGLPPDPLIVVLEGVEKPGNLGAVLRSADGAGADAVIVADPRTDPYNPNAIRASLGTVFAVPVAAASSAEVRGSLVTAGVRLVAARVGADQPYTTVDLRGAIALVLGSEVGGLSEAWTGDDISAVSLPMHGVGDSLNVSITAAVLLYEARRQRGGATG